MRTASAKSKNQSDSDDGVRVQKECRLERKRPAGGDDNNLSAASASGTLALQSPVTACKTLILNCTQ